MVKLKGGYILIEEFFKVIFEILFYHIGKFVAAILFPRINISESTQEPKRLSKNSFKFTYEKKKRKYFYTDSITLIGFVFCICIVAIIILINIKI